MRDLTDILTIVAVLGSGLVAGIFFAFSTFVMRALARLRPTQGVAAMQAINPFFLLAFFGSCGAAGQASVAANSGSGFLRKVSTKIA